MSNNQDMQRYLDLVYVYKQDVYRIIMNVIDDHHTAEDLTQNVMVNAWKGFHTLREPEKSKAWVKAITSNVIKGYMREKKIYLSIEDRQIYRDIQDESILKSIEVDILKALIEREEIEIVFKALNSLNPDMKMIIMEHLITRDTLKTVAERHGMNYGTVREYYSRGMKLLKERCEILEKGGDLNG